MKKTILFQLGVILFVLIISLPLLIPYLKGGYFPTHDGEWAVVRLSDMFRQLRDFQIPPRFSENLNAGYGYPIFNFAYPFPYYVGSLIHLLGFGFVNSVKLVFALSIPLSAYFMFLASRVIWKNDYAGLISSVLYLYFPYRLVDLYVRGSIGESVAFVIFPLILLSIYKSYVSKFRILYLIMGAISFGILITSHNIMALLFSLTLGVFFISNYLTIKKDVLKTYLFVVLFGILLSAYFWIPAMLEKSFVKLSLIPIADKGEFYVSIYDLLFSPWGYGIPSSTENGFTYQIGWSFILIILTTIGLLIYKNYKKIKLDKDQIFSIIILLGIGFFIFMLFPVSSFVWRLPILTEITFPWTTFSQIGLLTSILAGFLVKNKFTRYVALIAVIIALVLNIPNARPSEYIDRGEGFYYTNDDTTTSSDEYTPLWVSEIPTNRPEAKVEIINGRGEIKNLIYNSKLIRFDLESESESIVRINTIYYPGWRVFSNGEEIPISYENNLGVMEFSLDMGRKSIEATFSETPLRLTADIISITALVILLIILIISRKKSLKL